MPPETRVVNAGELAGQELDKGAGRLALLAVCLGFFVIQLDVTIVNVALPVIQRQIGGSVAGLQWIVDAYTLAFAAVMLTAGHAADRLGGRRIFLAGLAIFAAGSAASALAPALPVLIAARAVQGLGAAALLPCSLALIVHQFHGAAARARALGLWGAMGSAGVALGPVAGGALVDSIGWRAIFAVNLPICAWTAWLVIRHVPESPAQPGRSADVPGLLLGAAALAGVTAGFITAGQAGWLTPLPAALVGAGIATGLLFVHAERRRAEPMLPLSLFRSRPLSAATCVGVLFNLCLYGALLCLSLFLQQVRHTSPAATGLLLLPMSLAVGIGSVASGSLTARTGPRLPMLAGLALAGGGAAVLGQAGPATPTWVLIAGSVGLGLCSLAMPAMTAVVVGAAGRERAGLASGVLNAARQSGGALGVALLGALFAGGQPAIALRAPMNVAVAGYALAIGLAWIAASAKPVPSEGARHEG